MGQVVGERDRLMKQMEEAQRCIRELKSGSGDNDSGTQKVQRVTLGWLLVV